MVCGFGSNSWDQVQFLAGQSIESCERANYARYRCIYSFPAVNPTGMENKDRKGTLKRIVMKGFYFSGSHCIAYPHRECPVFLYWVYKRLPLLAEEEVTMHIEVTGMDVDCYILTTMLIICLNVMFEGDAVLCICCSKYFVLCL